MIRRIELIINFGIFRNFRWNYNLPEFAKLNLIYGWNYSGKTTLSRLFQALEHKKFIEDYSNAHFQLLTGEGSQISSVDLSASPVVRVFNRDYVDANFSRDYSAPAIYILGEENIALRKRLEHLTKRRDGFERFAGNLLKKINLIRNELDRLGTEKARDIRNLLSNPTFERPKLNKRIEEIRLDPAIYIKPDNDVSALLATLKSGDQFSNVPPVSSTLPSFILLVQEVNELLSQTASQRAIEHLKQNREVESWVRQGLSLHKDTSTCKFCGGALTAERIEELRGHFSEAYENLFREIDAKIKQINTIRQIPIIPDEMHILPEYRQKFSNIKSQLNAWFKWATTTCDQLIEVLKQKQVTMESQRKWEGDLGRADQGQQLLKELNQIIVKHNHTISRIDQAKEEAKIALERHYAALHFRDNKIEQKEKEILRLNERLDLVNEILRRINSDIQKIEKSIKQSTVGVTKLNDLLKYLLPGNNIKAVDVGDNQFQFYRDRHIATHLSDGEKTAVTFSYFLTSLEEKGANLSNTIVFIDDPISSLDSNHIYAVYALIAERLENSRQLFVSTHNGELFNLLKSKWLDERNHGRNKQDTRAYNVWRSVDSAGEPFANLRDLPILLRKFKSEYEFIFSQLHSFATIQNPSLNDAFTAPNLLRKFLEAYLGFRKPSIRSWSNKLDLLLDSPAERLEIEKFADDASHLQSLGRLLEHPEFVSNAQRCVMMVLDALREKDKDHYESLCNVVMGASV